MSLLARLRGRSSAANRRGRDQRARRLALSAPGHRHGPERHAHRRPRRPGAVLHAHHAVLLALRARATARGQHRAWAADRWPSGYIGICRTPSRSSWSSTRALLPAPASTSTCRRTAPPAGDRGDGAQWVGRACRLHRRCPGGWLRRPGAGGRAWPLGVLRRRALAACTRTACWR